MDLLVAGAGALLIVVMAHDVFHTLFHPEGRGSLSSPVQRGIWTVARAMGRRHAAPMLMAGPLMVVAVILTWLALSTVGWALIYWAHMPDGFVVTTDNLPPQEGIVAALYQSLVTLGTLGYGDIAPVDGRLRILGPLQALVGFGLLTASISWVLSIHPALRRLRSLAGDLSAIDEASGGDPLAYLSRQSAAGRRELIHEVSSRLVTVGVDLAQFPSAFYFETRERRLSLAHALPVAAAVSAAARDDADPDVRAAGERCCVALEQLVRMIGEQFLKMPGAPPERVLVLFRSERATAASKPRPLP
jgi:hypothetical protein